MHTSFHDDPSTYENLQPDEPQLTSDDANERKLARKLRIERRWNVIRKSCMEESESLHEGNKTAVQLQVQKSAEILEKFLEEAEEYVTNVRVANDSREVDRREVEGIGREKIIAQLEAEAAAAHQAFEEIAVKWSVIQKYNDPLHINEDIANQKEKCEFLIKQKDEIIAMLREELKNAEIKFTKDQKKQSEDINILAQRIEKQITFMRKAYQNEFELIEQVILSERQNFIDLNNKKWEELHKKRDQQEIENSNKKFGQLEEFNKNMYRLRVDFQEKFRETKIKLENDIENLQKELERIKALALLNSEKLDYNYQILKKREDENLIIKSQQKRRINKLQDVKNDLRKKITDYETTAKNHVKKLSDDIKKLHKSILEVEAKADHFAKVNDEKFHQVWEMNKNKCQAILTRILATDKILYEQQMGIEWLSPPHSIINKTTLSSFKDALNVVSKTSAMSNKSSVDHKMSKRLEHSDSETKKVQQKPEQLDANPIYRRLLKYILTLVSDKSGFLTEKRLKMLLKFYEDDQKTLVRLDNVLMSLDIRRPEDIDMLVKYFIPYCFCSVCNNKDLGTESTLSRYNSQLSHFSVISRNENQSNVEIIELEEAFSAIQQPDNVIEEVVMDLVSSEIYSEGLHLEQESLDNVCGGIVLDQFYSDLKEKRFTKKKMITSDDKVLCQYNHPLVISSVFILMALRDFVTAYYTHRKAIPTTRERLEKKRNTISRLLTDADIRLYWDKYKTVYNEERIRVWEALLEGLKNYHEILKDRKTLSEEVVVLRRQNVDLKRLLANYIDHGEFMNPPCAMERNEHLHTLPPPYTNFKGK
ncbi:dynein regulatory complex protein 1 [Leptinotarsa decemlineata]|uniref:dynein regulatory complex protein 1 n=1 Tax=Leptinotarsa decemlineata TaxID=7539 RepID=UPI000C2527C7|nr:dynein regulatory complex protein 1 [Leptinotarsa decemlineata]